MTTIYQKALLLRVKAHKANEIRLCKSKYGDSWEENWELFKEERNAASKKELELTRLRIDLARMSDREVAEMVWDLQHKVDSNDNIKSIQLLRW